MAAAFLLIAAQRKEGSGLVRKAEPMLVCYECYDPEEYNEEDDDLDECVQIDFCNQNYDLDAKG